MKKIIIALVFLIAVMGIWSGESGRVIPELVKPTALQVDGNRLYVVEDTTVHIFDLSSLKAIGKFGKAGQGPQEFQTVPGQLPLILNVGDKDLVVASVGKISRWTKDGQYISEYTYNPQNALNPQMLKNGNFLGLGVSQEDDKKLYRQVFLCDGKMNRIKEVYKAEHVFQGPGKGLKAMGKVFSYNSSQDQIYLPGAEENEVNAYSLDMTPKFTVSVPKDNRAVDQEFKDRFMDELNADPNLKGQMEFLKPIIFPDKYPSISFFAADEDVLYVFTWNFGKDSLEYYSFATKDGKALGQNKVPIRFQGSLSPYPVTFNKGIVYQLVENEDEEWELVSASLK